MTDDTPEHFRKRIQEAKEQQLEELDLSYYWNTDDPDKLTKILEEVFDLKYLKILNISNNRISILPKSLGNLTNLTELCLSFNQFKKLPESLGSLTNLTSLYLTGNKLTKLPKSLGNLTNLTELYLSSNKLKILPKSLGNLTNLTELYLSSNKLKDLPESLGNLTNLTALGLSFNKLKILPESLGNLTNLNDLNLNNNQLTNLPKSLGNLTNLTELDLHWNNLTNLPESLGNLTNLTELDLHYNNLTKLPESLSNLNNLIRLSLHNNPLVEPPIEIIQQGTKAIINYLRQLKEEGLDYIYEAKLLIVGEAGAGKTTLAKKIDNPDYQLKEREESTEGIDIIKWSFPFIDKEQKQQNFQINIWDFGGQEIYHATHQFFLTKRSLYALVADTRKENTDFYYWLNVVALLSDNSPLLIIKNEKQDRKREINETALRGQFTNLEKTLATNLATNRGLPEIITEIKHYIQQLPHVGQTLPRTWAKVRQTLEQDDRNYISLQEYLDICENNGFTRHEDKLQLSGYLHDLGVCLHFQDEEESLLYKTVILKPDWGTNAVYTILDNEQVVHNQGRFTRDDLKNIWHEETYASMRGELLELMKKFQLCYQIPGKKNAFIAPQLLSGNQPEYDWDKFKNLILRYTYPPFMPKGIITRFIVVMHQFIDQPKYVWKTGVILSKKNTKAEVIEYYGRREIRIRVAGNNKRDFLTVIAHELDKINKSYRQLEYQKRIPCNCYKCKYSKSPNSYSFEVLLRFIADNKARIQCEKSYQMVKVLSLIDDVIIWNQANIAEEYQNYSPNKNQSLVSVNIHNPQQHKGDKNTMSSIHQNNYSKGDNFISGSGDSFAGDKNTTNIYNSQDLTQAAAEIKALLEELEKTYPTNNTTGKMAIATEAIQRIDNDPKLTSRILSAIKAGGVSALDSLLDHPAASFVIGALEDWQQNKN